MPRDRSAPAPAPSPRRDLDLRLRPYANQAAFRAADARAVLPAPVPHGREVTSPLPLPDDPRLRELLGSFYRYKTMDIAFPRSRWRHDFEAILREHYPQASSDELTLTARLAAPFPLAKPGVP